LFVQSNGKRSSQFSLVIPLNEKMRFRESYRACKLIIAEKTKLWLLDRKVRTEAYHLPSSPFTTKQE
jgi:hypothetical protein